jgi:glycosyltransferase involved in cell wall biosynthesis
MKERSLADGREPVAVSGGRQSILPGNDTETSVRANDPRKRLLIVAPHVVQYSSPLFREMAHHPELDLLVAYCSMRGAEAEVDPGFGVKVSWDTPLLEGYPWTQVPNHTWCLGCDHFFGLFNPGLWALIRDGHFDALLICGYYFASAWIAVCAAKWFGVPFIFVSDSHGLRSWKARSEWKIRFKKWLLRWIFSLPQAVVVSSTGGVEYLKSLGYPASRISLAPTSVNNAWWIEQAAKADRNVVRSAWKIPADASAALFCAKLQPWKAPADLLEAFAAANVANSYLVFAGDGPERDSLERRAAELDVTSRVRFLGFVNQSQLPSAYCAADVFVLPSLFEPFGLVVNEAMLCGLPVVVSDRVGAKFDLVRPGENGYVYPAGNIEALARVLREVLPNPEQRARLGAAARQRMETWSPREYTEGMVRAVQLVGIKDGSL